MCLRKMLVAGGVCHDEQNLTDRVVIVTGCGPKSIGLATAKLLHGMGATVVVTTRSESGSADAVNAVVTSCSESGNADAIGVIDGLESPRCFGHPLDLSKEKSIADFCAWFLKKCDGKLHILVNNAGIHLDLASSWKEPHLTENGYEMHWDVNFLGTTKLTGILLPALKATALEETRKNPSGRIVNVISELHRMGAADTIMESLEYGGPTPSKKYSSWTAYGQSKLAILLYSKELSRRMQDETGGVVTSNCLHPGAVYSTVANKGLEGHKFLLGVRKVFAFVEAWLLKTPEEGAQTSLYCAISPSLQGIGGRYYKDCREKQSSRSSMDADIAKQLFEQVNEKLNIQLK